MTKRTSARLQTSGPATPIPPNELVTQKLGIDSPLHSLEGQNSISQQASKPKRVTRPTKGENTNNKIAVKTEKNGTGSNILKPKPVATPKTSHLLPGGTIVSINDHVYLAQSDPNAPHLIGRIMAFIKDNLGIHVKVAIYYRQKDLVAIFPSEKDEPRKLIATIHCEKFPVRVIQGKCTVVHPDYINDMESYTQLDDHFYFDELFDRFSLISYKVLPTDKITNMPEQYANILKEKYHFIASEPAQMKEYLKEFQECPYCGEWCSEQEGIECSSCNKTYHRKCMATPVKNKPRKGYIFECSTCVENSREKHEELQSQNALDDRKSAKSDHSDRLTKKHNDISHKEKSNTHPYLNSNKQPIIKDQDASSYTNPPLRSTEGWIYRYFGKNSYLEDLEDPHDSIYPRAGNRVGPKYQATIPDLLSNSAANLDQPNKHSNQYTKKKTKKLRYIPLQCSEPIFQVKSEEHETKIQKTMDLIRSEPKEYSLPVYSNALLNKAVRLMDDQTFNPEAVVEKLKKSSIMDLQNYLLFTEEEQNTFEHALCKYAEDIEGIAKSFPNRPLPQVVEYFYKWASKTVGNKAKSTSFKVKLRNMAKTITHGIEPLYIEESRDIGKLTKTRSSARSNSACAHCQSKLEKLTYQLHPEIMDELKISGDLCSKCYTHWTKYFQLPPITEEAIRLNKENATKPVIINKKRSNEHNNTYSAKELKERQLMKKLGSSERSKQLKQSLVKSRFDPNLLTDNIPLPPLGCCALGNSFILFKGLKSLELALPSPNNANSNSIAPSSTAQSSTEENHHNEKISDGKSDTKSHPSIILKLSIPSSCSICHSKQNPEQIMKCRTCKTSVHKKCYLLPSDFKQPKDWNCNECLNKLDVNYYQNYTCVLCRKPNSEETSNSPVKPTISGNWAHIICSLFLTSIHFTNSNNQYKVNGISEAPIDDWKKECSICHKSNSLSAKCKGCETNFHVTCALQNNCELGFIKLSRSHHGHLEPVIYCNDCKLSDKLEPLEPLSNLSFFDLKDLHKKNFRKNTYSHHLNTPSSHYSHALKISDLVTEEVKIPNSNGQDNLEESNIPIVDHSSTACSKCKSETSAVWWPSLDYRGEYICQSCHFDQIAPNQASTHKRKIILRVKPEETNRITSEGRRHKHRKVTSTN